MLGHCIQRLPFGTSRRAYSFFSSKPGGGRYFNSAKPHKVSPGSTTASASAKAKARRDDGSPSASPPDDAQPTNLGQEDAPSPVLSSSPPSALSSESSPAPVPRLPPHPTFSDHTYPLHHFFSLHRPLLLLPLSTSTLFESPSTSFDDATSISLAPPEAGTLSFDDISETPADADADAARQLARALALNRVGGLIHWEETLARLGDVESIRALRCSTSADGLNGVASMDSTKRKKRKKMSKHK